MKEEEYLVENLDETKKLAEKIAEKLDKGFVLKLNGNLGAGKTFFTGCIINFLLKKNNLKMENVLSPTFNIVKEYQLKDYSIYHFDLYRIKNKEELCELDFDYILENHISIIEWPEIADSLIQGKIINIDIKILNDSRRKFKISYID